MDSKKNLYSPKCLCGVSVVKACSVFATINAVLVGLMILGSLVTVVLVNVKFASGYIADLNDLFDLVAAISIAVAFYVGTIFSAIFAAILIMGIRKKKAQFVKAYLIYGIIVEVALIIGTFIYIGVKSQPPYSQPGVMFFAIYGSTAVCICILYGYIVQLVYITYIVFKNSPSNSPEVQTLCLAQTEGSQFGNTIHNNSQATCELGKI